MRRRDLDVIRELLVASLVFFHTARIFDDLGFHIKNEPPEAAVTLLVIFAAMWGMPTLFTMAGFAIWHSLQKRTLDEFVRERLLRLLVPFIVGLLIIVPPQIYYQHLAADPPYQGSFAEFYPRFFDMALRLDFPWFFAASPGTGLFEPAHLWFLYVLLVYTLLMLPILLYLRRSAGQQLIGRLATFIGRRYAIFLLALPIAIVEAALGSSMSGGWNEIAYVVFLIYGYLLAADARFEQAFCRHWQSSLVIALMGSIAAIGALTVFVAQAGVAPANPLVDYDVISVTLRFCKGLVGGYWIMAIFGFLAVRRATRKMLWTRRGATSEPPLGLGKSVNWDKVERYANEAVLPFYLLHQTVIVIVGYYVVQWQSSALVKFWIISLASLAITLLLYEIVIKRTQWTRFLLGMKPVGKGRRSAQ